MNESLSRLHDEDLPLEEARALVARTANDPAARDRWTRYQLIGDVIRGNTTPDDGFTQRILVRLEGVSPEPGYDPLADQG
jgi:negative regulator of sigma E activity